MKVSVIIPAFNAERWIKQCLDSVIRQSYKNLEIIILNDGSTDRTIYILYAYRAKDARIIVLDKENTGTYQSRTEGIRKSTGDVIFNADADDFLEPDAIELLVAKMIETDADMVIGNNYQLQNSRKKIIRNKLPLQQNKIELVRSLLNNEIKGYIWGKLYKRELLTDMNYEVPHLLQEDVLANLHIFINKKIKVALEPTPVYNYIIHKNSANSSRNPVFIENIYEFIKISRRLLEEADCLDELKDDFQVFKCRNWIVYSRLGGKLAKDKNFRRNFYRENYTAYSKANLALYQNIEILVYRYNYDFGRMTTNLMKRLNRLMNYTYVHLYRRKRTC